MKLWQTALIADGGLDNRTPGFGYLNAVCSSMGSRRAIKANKHWGSVEDVIVS